MRKEYVQVRLEKSVHEQLEAAKDRLETSAKRKPRKASESLQGPTLSLSDAIEALVAFYNRETNRKRNYKRPKLGKAWEGFLVELERLAPGVARGSRSPSTTELEAIARFEDDGGYVPVEFKDHYGDLYRPHGSEPQE